ncbi:hypothetical protein [Frigidibacter sp. SD6-1]|uniref:hypothetical protein n=1 Tax=Frigidibacter sp. SD6-1 TaxID=3032581 RepID=UPI0024E02173|nr:hypothetical protein [Frigidibacter sp. SD6-1]
MHIERVFQKLNKAATSTTGVFHTVTDLPVAFLKERTFDLFIHFDNQLTLNKVRNVLGNLCQLHELGRSKASRALFPRGTRASIARAMFLDCQQSYLERESHFPDIQALLDYENRHPARFFRPKTANRRDDIWPLVRCSSITVLSGPLKEVTYDGCLAVLSFEVAWDASTNRDIFFTEGVEPVHFARSAPLVPSHGHDDLAR